MLYNIPMTIWLVIDESPAPEPAPQSLRIEPSRSVVKLTTTITFRVPLEVRDGLCTLKANTGKSSQDLIQFALERLLADNGIN